MTFPTPQLLQLDLSVREHHVGAGKEKGGINLPQWHWCRPFVRAGVTFHFIHSLDTRLSAVLQLSLSVGTGQGAHLVDVSASGQQLTCMLLTHMVHYSATNFEKNIFLGKKLSLDSHISKTDFLLESPGAVCTRQHKQAASLQQTLPAKESSCNAPGPYSWFLHLSAGSAFGFVSTFWQLALS